MSAMSVAEFVLTVAVAAGLGVLVAEFYNRG